MNLIQGKPGTAGAATTAGGWEKSYMRTVVMPDILSKMENKDYITEVEKKTLKENSNTEIVVTRDKLFLLSLFWNILLCKFTKKGDCVYVS